MLLAGDEFGRTQGGNNNAYAQDSEISWTHWRQIDEAGHKLTQFVREIIALRQAQPLLRRESFRDGMTVEWLNPAGGFQTDEAWNDAGATTIGLRLARDFGQGDAVWNEALILFNAVDAETHFTLPARQGASWRLVVDTAAADRAEGDALFSGDDGPQARLFPRSLMLLA